jgi:hypothetical protein
MQLLPPQKAVGIEKLLSSIQEEPKAHETSRNRLLLKLLPPEMKQQSMFSR